MGWGQIPEDRERWLAFVYKIMNLRFPYNAGSLSNNYDFFKKDLNHGVNTVIIIHGRYKIHCVYLVFWHAFEPITSQIRSISAHNLTVKCGNTGNTRALLNDFVSYLAYAASVMNE